jgi:hypothetical protein
MGIEVPPFPLGTDLVQRYERSVNFLVDCLRFEDLVAPVVFNLPVTGPASDRPGAKLCVEFLFNQLKNKSVGTIISYCK